MKVKLISIQLTTGNIPEQRKIDKRYKRGYKVISESQMTYLLQMRLSNPDAQFKSGDDVITQYGLFKVVRINNIVNGGEMQLMQHRSWFIGNEFEFNAEIDVELAARAYGESSLIPKY